MSTRRQLLQGALALAAPLPAFGAARPPRIYMILFRGRTGVETGFRDYFAAEGIEAEFIERDVALDVGRVPALVEEARALKADLIYTWGTPVTLAVVGKEGKVDPARHVTDIPVVFTMVASPEGAGLVSSRASSHRNITGASHVVPMAQQLSAMRAYRPFTRLGTIYSPAEANSIVNLEELRAGAARDRFTLVERAVPLDAKGQPVAAALPQLLADMARQRVQFLYMGPDSFLTANRKLITDTAVDLRLPTFSATEGALRDGRALFGIVSGYENVGRLTASKAVRILRDRVAPAAIPIETLARFSYIVNIGVAAQLDFYPPLKVVNFAEILK
jgi:putative ABC transport system substrate-binding protein